MTTKLEQAARQALEALEEMFHSNSTKVAVEKYNTAHNALLEALEQPNEIDWIETNKALANEIIELQKQAELNLNCKSVQARLATSWGYVKADQAEQEPVGVVEGSGEWGIAGVLVAGIPIGTKLYAAPVRTKDLTDDEIEALWMDADGIALCRAVIAAYKEKNK